MSGPTPPESPDPGVPPEVPAEFADAYRAAYERALAAQSEVEPHRSAARYDREDADDPDRLPRRAAPLRVGTHRDRKPPTPPPTSRPEGPRRPTQPSILPAPTPPSELDQDGDPTAYERIRDSRWFVPLLLLVLAVLLILGAYAVGRAFAGTVGQ